MVMKSILRMLVCLVWCYVVAYFGVWLQLCLIGECGVNIVLSFDIVMRQVFAFLNGWVLFFALSKCGENKSAFLNAMVGGLSFVVGVLLFEAVRNPFLDLVEMGAYKLPSMSFGGFFGGGTTFYGSFSIVVLAVGLLLELLNLFCVFLVVLMLGLLEYKKLLNKIEINWNGVVFPAMGAIFVSGLGYSCFVNLCRTLAYPK